MLERLMIAAAPKAQGPYCTVVRAGDFLYLSGQGPVDPVTNKMQSNATVQEQTKLVLHNLRAVLLGCGADLADVVKCAVFLEDVKDFPAMNEAYAEVFGDIKPARTTVGAGMVAEGMKVEIDCVAYKPVKA